MVGNRYVNLLWKLTLMINGRANKSFIIYLVINETNNGGAGVKTKSWSKYISGLNGSN